MTSAPDPLHDTRDMTPARNPLHGEHGFTLVEMLVAMVTGMVVILATLSILDISISQSSRISERVDADQRGRLAMEKILLELHSSCIASGVIAVEQGSTPTSIRFISQTGPEAFFTSVTRHVISLNTETGNLTDASYLSTNTASELGTSWKFAEAPTSTQTLLTGVTQQSLEGTTVPLFKYFQYEGGNLSATPLNTPLSLVDAENAVEVTVSFRVAPSFTAYHASAGTQTDRGVDLSNSVVLRFDPASATGGNEPCA